VTEKPLDDQGTFEQVLTLTSWDRVRHCDEHLGYALDNGRSCDPSLLYDNMIRDAWAAIARLYTDDIENGISRVNGLTDRGVKRR
jgi:hypothetical protein